MIIINASKNNKTKGECVWTVESRRFIRGLTSPPKRREYTNWIPQEDEDEN